MRCGGRVRPRKELNMRWLARQIHDYFNEPPQSSDPYAELPFEMTLPPGWQPDDNPPGIPADLRSDAVFFARDPHSTDPAYSSTVLVMASQPADDPHEFLDRQEAELQPLSTQESATFGRITLPAGEALSVRGEEESWATIQYFLPTSLANFVIGFTTPLAELSVRQPEFEAIARSFRLK